MSTLPYLDEHGRSRPLHGLQTHARRDVAMEPGDRRRVAVQTMGRERSLGVGERALHLPRFVLDVRLCRIGKVGPGRLTVPPVYRGEETPSRSHRIIALLTLRLARQGSE